MGYIFGHPHAITSAVGRVRLPWPQHTIHNMKRETQNPVCNYYTAVNLVQDQPSNFEFLNIFQGPSSSRQSWYCSISHRVETPRVPTALSSNPIPSQGYQLILLSYIICQLCIIPSSKYLLQHRIALRLMG